ncbi:MAG: hypothetical protein K1X65_14820 [Caldilineales bacterium]|nr:hypothetical protein [Caldilineales bacterium]
MTTPEPIAVTLLVVEALESLGVSYVIGGSLASTLHGMARATLDSDLVADLQLQHVKSLVALLHDRFYIDESAAREAIQLHRSFNIIHLPTMFKVDIFIPKQRAFDQAQLSHRVMHRVSTEPGRSIYVSSPEDTILAKLEWYRLGGEVSERQWRDVVGIVSVQGDRLDWDYLRRAASQLGVADLLEKLAAE